MLILTRTKLTGPAHNQKAIATGSKFSLNTKLSFLSLGFRGNPISGLPFNEKEGLLYNKYVNLYKSKKISKFNLIFRSNFNTNSIGSEGYMIL